MARSLEWSELKTGLIGTSAIAAIVIGTLFFARVGALRGDTGTLYVYSDEATGVLPGTEVWLSGEKIGQVKRIHYRDISTDTTRRLSIETLILADKMQYIRRDARVDIRPGGNLIGTPVIYIAGGTSGFRALRAGDTLVTVSNSAFKPIGVRVDSLSARLTQLADTAKKLGRLITSTQGTLGAFQKNGLPRMPDAVGTMDDLMEKATKGDGSLGLAMRGDVGARVARLMAAKDSITILMTSGKGTLGRFRNDSTLFRNVASVKAQVDSLKLMFSGKGTVSRARSDSSLTVELRRMSAELSALMAELKANPRRFINF